MRWILIYEFPWKNIPETLAGEMKRREWRKRIGKEIVGKKEMNMKEGGNIVVCKSTRRTNNEDTWLDRKGCVYPETCSVGAKLRTFWKGERYIKHCRRNFCFVVIDIGNDELIRWRWRWWWQIDPLTMTMMTLCFKGMLDRRPNLNDVDNTDISNSELKMKWQR